MLPFLVEKDFFPPHLLEKSLIHENVLFVKSKTSPKWSWLFLLPDSLCPQNFKKCWLYLIKVPEYFFQRSLIFFFIPREFFWGQNFMLNFSKLLQDFFGGFSQWSYFDLNCRRGNFWRRTDFSVISFYFSFFFGR